MDTASYFNYSTAKRKAEVLKSLYLHLIVYVVINAILILFSAHVFDSQEVNFYCLENYFIPILWGIGLFFHVVFVLLSMYFNTAFIKRWEAKKIKEIINKQ